MDKAAYGPREDSHQTSAYSDRSLICLSEETMGHYLPIEHTVNTLVRQYGWPGS